MLPVAILAGGLATRLRPLSNDTPKSLVPINGQPFLHYQLRLLRRRGVERVVLCVGHFGERIQASLAGSDWNLQIDLSYDGTALLGTGGAIRKALPLLGDSFFVLYGDSYLPCNYGAVEQAFVSAGTDALMTVFHNADRWDASNVEFDKGRIVAYDKAHRTTAMRHIDYGVGVFRSSAFESVPDAPFDLASVYQDLLRRDQLAGFEVEERFYEAGSFAGLHELTELLTREGVRK